MQNTYWSAWRRFLTRWGLVSPTCVFIDIAQPLLPFVGQMMIIGWPLFKSAALGHSYEALLTMLGDADVRMQFTAYLQEVKG